MEKREKLQNEGNLMHLKSVCHLIKANSSWLSKSIRYGKKTNLMNYMLASAADFALINNEWM
jgi:hypothetical protein